jgi:transglutaminase-like putative cysteine protease
MRALIMVVLLLSLAAAGTTISEPKLVKQVSLDFIEGGTVTSTGSLHEVELNITLPQESTYLKAEYSIGTVVDADGNVLAHIKDTSPRNPFSYSLSTKLTSNERTLNALPSEYELLPAQLKYAQPSEHAKSGSPQVAALAREITANSTTDFERVAKLAIWVHDNLDYDASLVGQKKDSDWVLANKRGVCVEYASLFNALARSIGIPARYVLGQSYGDYGWLGHAWSEVFIGEWVPVDPTWLEVGQLDATHIAFFRSPETEAASRVVAKVGPGDDLDWNKPDFAGSQDEGTRVEVSNVVMNDEITSLPLQYGTDELGFGESTVVFLPITAPDYRVVDLSIANCVGATKVLSLDEGEKDVILEPGKQRVAAWIITAGSLDSSSVYTCPVTLNSGYLKEEDVSITVEKQPAPAQFTASLKQQSVSLGESQTVYVETKSSGFEIGYVAADGYGSKQAAATRQAFSFTPTTLGPQTVYVYSSDGGVKTLQFSVTKSSDIIVKSILSEASVPANKEFNVAAVVANNKPVPEDVEVRIIFGNNSYVKRVSVNGTETVRTAFNAGASGDKTITVEARAVGASADDSLQITVFEPPSVVYAPPEFSTSSGGVVTSISFSPSAGALNATLDVDGKQYDASGVVELALPAGSYRATLRWSDAAGNPYAEKFEIAMPEEAPAVKPAAKPADLTVLVVAGAVLFALVFMLLLLVAFLRLRSAPKP